MTMKYNEGTHCIPCELQKKVWETLEASTVHQIFPVPNLADNKFCEEHEKEFDCIRAETNIRIWDYIAGYAITCNY